MKAIKKSQKLGKKKGLGGSEERRKGKKVCYSLEREERRIRKEILQRKREEG